MADKRKPKGVEQVETHHTRQVRAAAIRDATGDFAIDDKRHRMWFLATSTDRCDDGMAIDATAWERDMPESVPFVDSHARHSIKLIYGRVVDKRYTPRGPVEQVEFATDDIHPDGKLAWYLYRNGYASDVSIAWTTLEKETRKTDDGREYIGVTRARQEELSGCIIGLDPKAESLHSDAELVALARSVVGGHCGKCMKGGGSEVIETRPGWDEPEGGEFIHYRIHDPGDFQEGTYAILSLDVKATKDVQVKRAKRTGDADDGELHAQAIQFEKAAGWTLAGAKEWWGDHKEKIDRMASYSGYREVSHLSWASIEGRWGDLRFRIVGEESFGTLTQEIKELRAVCNALLVRIGEPEAPPKIEVTNKPPEPSWLRDMRKTAAAVTLTGAELMEEITRHGSDADAETRSE